jgi:hypothetical protein
MTTGGSGRLADVRADAPARLPSVGSGSVGHGARTRGNRSGDRVVAVREARMAS